MDTREELVRLAVDWLDKISDEDAENCRMSYLHHHWRGYVREYGRRGELLAHSMR